MLNNNFVWIFYEDWSDPADDCFFGDSGCFLGNASRGLGVLAHFGQFIYLAKINYEKSMIIIFILYHFFYLL